jgi:hypothetical protein
MSFRTLKSLRSCTAFTFLNLQVELNSRLLESHMELIIETNRNVVNTDHEDCTLVNRLLNKIPNRNFSNNC